MTHREYLLMNSTHQPALEPWSGCYIYNFADATVRQFWTDMCVARQPTKAKAHCLLLPVAFPWGSADTDLPHAQVPQHDQNGGD